MTKDELLQYTADENYKRVQLKIQYAMRRAESSETFCLANYSPLEGWDILPATIERLKQDGFTVEQCNNSYGLFEGTIKVSW